ncbi:MAG: acyltransferase [Brevinema sp.]
MNKSLTKDQSIVWFRAIATIMVVILHAVSVEYHKEPSTLRTFWNTINSFTRLCVPIFAMISGYLLWARTTEPSLGLALKRFWSIFKIISYFGLVYYLVDIVRGKGYYHFTNIFFNDDTDGKWRGFLWYMFAILPLYSLSPFISLPKNQDQKFYIKFTALLIFIFFITQAIKTVPFNIDSHYSLNKMFLYFMLGFSLGQINFHRNYSYLFCTLYIISSLTIAFCESYLNPSRDQRFFSDSGVFVLSQSISFFIFIRSLDFDKILETKIGKQFNSFFEVFAKYSIGVYGWHIVTLNTLQKLLSNAGLRGYQFVLLTLFLTLIGALTIAILDYHFWKSINTKLDPLYQRIKNKFSSITKNNIT